MQLFDVCSGTLLVLIVFYVEICTASRNKRQIIFEDDNVNRLSNSDCTMPDRRPGRCVRLRLCPVLLQTVSRHRLRRYFCGFEGDEPKVCCPQTRTENTTPRPIINTTPRTTQRTVRTTQRTVRTTQRTRTTVRVPEDPRNVGNPFINNPRSETTTKPAFLPQTCGVGPITATRIIGGGEAEVGAWPWMTVVYVQRSNGVMVPDCGGALVTNQHVVTAAHCVVTGRNSRPLEPSRLRVRLGAHDLRNENEREAINVNVESVQRHENFEPRTYRNDIAVLKLARPITFTKRIAPVCLPYDSLRGGDEDLMSRTAYVIGHGTTAFNGNSSDVLLQAGFNVLSQDVCKRAYEPEVQFTRVYMCAGIIDGTKDACQGDSGGPLQMIGNNSRYYLIGVVSFGKRCGEPGFPGVYTRVTEFLDWLTRHLSN